MEKPNENQNEISNQNSHESIRKNVIQIPSYEEVFNSGSGSGSNSNPKPYNLQTPNPPPSFTQAFSFLKSSEFYVAPPEDEPIRTASEAVPSSSANDSSLNRNNAVVQNRNAILVSHRQKGNPLLKHIRNVRWVFADVVCDYLLGQSSCALYLSLRYHLLHPDYLYFRIRELQKNFKLRVVLCHVDVEDVVKPLLEVTKTAMLHDCTLLCGWSLEECGRYLETIKVYENKSPDLIREQTDTDYLSRLTHALTSVRHVNKTDVMTLGSTFGSLSGIMDASMEDLARCPGIGERKVRRLYETFHEPFRRRVPARSAIAEPKTPPEAKSVEGSPSAKDSNIDKGKNSSTQDSNKEPSEANKKPKSDVKSALSAAFAKYSDKIKKPEISSSEKGEGSSNV